MFKWFWTVYSLGAPAWHLSRGIDRQPLRPLGQFALLLLSFHIPRWLNQAIKKRQICLMQPRVYINWGQTRPAIVGVSCWNARERQHQSLNLRVILHWIMVSRRLLQALELWSSAQKSPFINIWRNLSFRMEESLCVIPRTNVLYIVTFLVTRKATNWSVSTVCKI